MNSLQVIEEAALRVDELPEPSVETPGENDQSDSSATDRSNVASKLVELAKDATLIHDQDDKCYALVEKDGVRHTFQLGTKGFESWLAESST